MASHIEEREGVQGRFTRGEQDEPGVKPYPGYKTLWFWLLLGWVASGADRTITGPTVTYMINAEVPLLSGTSNPFALGGLVGSLLFAGYMLTQSPAASSATGSATER